MTNKVTLNSIEIMQDNHPYTTLTEFQYWKLKSIKLLIFINI